MSMDCNSGALIYRICCVKMVKLEVGGSLVAADAMFLEPCHAVIYAKILPGINGENFAVKN